MFAIFLVLIAITGCIAFLIKFLFIQKQDLSLLQSGNYVIREDYEALEKKLRSLTPEQLDRLVEKCEEELKNARFKKSA
jgi:hypothetical protein